MPNNKFHSCPVCGYDRLPRAAYGELGLASFQICPCCGVQFGLDDTMSSHDVLRQDWLRNGAPWYSDATLPPEAWNAEEQLRNAGLLPTDTRGSE